MTNDLHMLVLLAGILLAGFVSGVAAFGWASVVRRLPVIEGWALSGRRPWSCDLCMSFWSSAFVLGVAELLHALGDGPVAIAAAPLALRVLARALVFSVSLAVAYGLLTWANALPPPGDPPPI